FVDGNGAEIEEWADLEHRRVLHRRCRLLAVGGELGLLILQVFEAGTELLDLVLQLIALQLGCLSLWRAVILSLRNLVDLILIRLDWAALLYGVVVLVVGLLELALDELGVLVLLAELDQRFV